MKKLILSLFLLPALCFGQGAHRISQVIIKGNGVSANVSPGSKVFVCAPNTGCATAANIYLDAGLTMPAFNPITADGSGNYDYYISSGCVDEQISSPGQGSIFVPNVCPFNGQGGGGGAMFPGTPGIVFNTSTTASRNAVYSDIVPLWQSGTCSGYLKSDGTCGNVSGNVIASPQYLVFIQPNAGTQAVAQGASIGQNGVAPMMQGKINPDLYATGSGNNGISNALASSDCVTGGCYFARPHTSTDSEVIAALTLNGNQNYVRGQDYTYGVDANYFLNAGSTAQFSVQNAHQDDYFWNDVTISPNANMSGHFSFLTVAMGGEYVGSPWTEIHLDQSYNSIYTRSISQEHSSYLLCFHVGDCMVSYDYMYYRNGSIATSDEGEKGRDLQMYEQAPPSGTITVGGANATTVQVNFTTNPNTQADGMNLLSESEEGTSGLLLSGTAPGGNAPYQMTTSDTHSVNTGYATLSGACGTNVARNAPVATNCTITGLVGSFSAAAGATVCVADWRYPEQVSVTAASVSQLTLGLTYTHPSGTVLEQGPMCGQKLVLGYGQTNPLSNSFITSYFVAGSQTSTTLDIVNAFKGGQQGMTGISIPTFPSQALGTLTRTSNVVTVAIGGGSGALEYNNFAAPSGAAITISGATPSDFNGTITGLTTPSPSLATWPQTGANETATGATLSLVGYNNYATYCGAEVVEVKGVSFGAYVPVDKPKLDGTMQLEPNNCQWPVGQAAIQPNHYSSNVAADDLFLSGFTPPTANVNTVHATSVSGAAWSGAIDEDYLTNDSLDDYLGQGGTWSGHTHFQSSAFYSGMFNMTHAPLDNGYFLAAGCLPEGCTSGFSWNIFELGGASGTSRMTFTPSTNAYNIDNLTIGGTKVCLSNGSNCPVSAVGTNGISSPDGSTISVSAGAYSVIRPIKANGRATLAAGTATVSSSSAGTSSIYQLTNCGVGGTEGMLSVGAVTANTSFVINSGSATDTSVVCWSIQ